MHRKTYKQEHNKYVLSQIGDRTTVDEQRAVLAYFTNPLLFAIRYRLM